ncbi:calcium uniporter protein, mitochondrial isoform X1 [Diabrotica virgifera virgifera]|uniref:Calcium uniporter protein n=1 Tax=Diabrotica virgifera virgifera TaxID=50390 RepID=A0ABM5L7M8_DIAVI|nr:calcium uniporter protein, mitochondrial isoform X1 [Diabrotica virgifera virgifera]
MALPRVLCRARLLLNNDIFVVSKYCSLVKTVSINKAVYVSTVRHFRTHFSSSVVLNSSKKEETDHKGSQSSSSSSSSSDSDGDSDSESEEGDLYPDTKIPDHVKITDKDVTVEYHKGLPQITVPLPSRKERCKFTLKPITNTVGDFLEMLKREDKGIDRVVCKSRDGTRIASSNTIETLLDDDFKLVINDSCYNVMSPKHERVTGEEIQRLNDVKNLVSQLYEAMHVQEHQLSKEKELTTQLETIKQELLPLEQVKSEIELVAQRRGNWLAWAGLGLMSVQFGILARLTWWEYSWDIMEPVTYFVTYGTAMACYAYFVLTKEEYILQDVRDRQHLMIIHKKSKKTGLDINQYNMLKQEAARIEYTLKKLRNPLKLKLPPRPGSMAATMAGAGVTPGTNVTVTLVDNPVIPPKIVVDPKVTPLVSKEELSEPKSESKAVKDVSTKSSVPDEPKK